MCEVVTTRSMKKHRDTGFLPGAGKLVLLLALFACGGNKERIVQEKIAERVSDFRKKETEKCQATLLADAERIVDSLLLYGALEEVNDSLRNRHPFKPVKPAHIAPMDSLPVKPIFDSTGGF